MIARIGDRVEAIHVTLDSHHDIDIAHPIWWRDELGQHPDPFTLISTADLYSGRWTTTYPEALDRSRSYVEALERNGRYPLCVWPYHCLIGSPGHAVAPNLFAALTAWEGRRFTPVEYVWKGANIWTEHYSAIRADVPDPADPGTQPNRALLESLCSADHIFIAGEAGSHCVANTVRDLASELGNEVLSRMTLITDAVSPVRGFEGLQDAFLRDMTALGLRTGTTDSFLSYPLSSLS
jgi:nicotinamidase-related amidase